MITVVQAAQRQVPRHQDVVRNPEQAVKVGAAIADEGLIAERVGVVVQAALEVVGTVVVGQLFDLLSPVADIAVEADVVGQGERVQIRRLPDQLRGALCRVEELGAVVQHGGHRPGGEAQCVLLPLQQEFLHVAHVLVAHPGNEQQRHCHQQQF